MKASNGCVTDETRQTKKKRTTTADAVENVIALKIWYNSAT